MDLYFHKPSGWGGQALAELGFVVRWTSTTLPLSQMSARMQLALDSILCTSACPGAVGLDAVGF